MPGCTKSAPKAARPVTFSRPSGRMVRLPIHLLSVEPFAVMPDVPFSCALSVAPACDHEEVCQSQLSQTHGGRSQPLSYKEAGGGQLPKAPHRYAAAAMAAAGAVCKRSLGLPPGSFGRAAHRQLRGSSAA